MPCVTASVPVPKPATPYLYQNFQKPIPAFCIFLTRLFVTKMPKISDADRKAKASKAIQLAEGLKSSGSGSGHRGSGQVLPAPEVG